MNFFLLEQNIVVDGEVLDPLIIWNNTILDGHNRYRILKKHPEIPFNTFPKDFPDKYVAIAWICRNQLGRRNLTPEQKRYLIGKQYEAEKASHGGHYLERDSETGQFTVSLQNEDLRIPERTSAKIAGESNTSRSFVERAEKYAKGVDAADELLPGIRKEILSGSIKPTQAEVAAIARAAPEDRAELAEQLRLPRAKPEKIEESEEIDDEDFEEQEPADNDTPVRIPKKSEILALAESMKDATEAVGLRLDYGQDKGKKRLPCISTAYTAFQKLGAERYMEMLQVILDAWNGAPDSFRRENVQGMPSDPV